MLLDDLFGQFYPSKCHIIIVIFKSKFRKQIIIIWIKQYITMGACQYTPPNNEHELNRKKPKFGSKIYVKEEESHSSFADTPHEDFAREVNKFPLLPPQMEEIRSKLQKELEGSKKEMKGEYVDKAYELQNSLIYTGEWKVCLKLSSKGKFMGRADSIFLMIPISSAPLMKINRWEVVFSSSPTMTIMLDK